MLEYKVECTCSNVEYGFNCVCDHVNKYPGDINYSCEFCGLYEASQPVCNKCEADTETHSRDVY